MKITTVAATLIGASVLLFIPPVFAQTDGVSVPQTSSDAEAYAPLYDEPLGEGPVLAPAPSQPEYSDPGSMYVPPPAYGLIEPFDHPPVSPTSPTLIPPDSLGIPAAGFHPGGGAFVGPIR
jgi:hypothetical protein